MRTPTPSWRRLIIAGTFTFAAAIASIGPVALPSSGVLAQPSGCANGEDGDLYTGTCVPYLVPNSPGANGAACPTGVTGAECGGQSTLPAPATPTPFQPSPEVQEFEDIATPGY